MPFHHYFTAIFTAILAGVFSIVASYFATSFSGERNTTQKLFEYRIESYVTFVRKTEQQESPALSRLLSFGSMIQHVVTDSEMQLFEDRATEFLEKYDTHHLYWQFDSAIRPLRLAGSTRVNKICNDIQLALMQHDDEVQWPDYSPEIAKRYDHWKSTQESGSAYAIEERISEEDRMMIVAVALLMQALIDQLRSEMALLN